MFTTPEDWALVARDMFTNAADAQAEFADFDRLVAQELTEKLSWGELEGFYAEAASSTLSRAEFEKLQATDTASFESGVSTMLREALTRATQNRHIKAVYCEYTMEAGTECRISARLCTSFSAGAQEWTSQFEGQKATISGPCVSEIFPAPGNARMSALAANVRSAYINARLLAAWGRAAQPLTPALPLGFAKQDLPLVTMLPGGK